MKKIFFLSAVLLFSTSLYSQQKPDALKAYNEGRYKEAISICQNEIVQTPRNIDSYVVLCWALLKENRYDEAYSWAASGREVSPYEPRLIEVQGEAMFYKGKNDDALKLFQDYIAYAPNGGRIGLVYFLMGEIYIRQGQYNHADIAITTAVLYDDNNSNWYTRLGYAREKAGSYVQAIEAYETALKIDPGIQDAVRGRDRSIASSRR